MNSPSRIQFPNTVLFQYVRPPWRKKKKYQRRKKYIHLSNVETIIIVTRFLSIGDMLLIGINKR